MAKFVSLIHGVNSFKLLREINKQAKKYNRIIETLLQIKIAEEDSKFGISPNEAVALLESKEVLDLQNIKIVGLMGMATFTDDKEQIKAEFSRLKTTFDNLKSFKTKNCSLQTLSMGMSGDYKIAIESGSTMIRVGSNIFGERNYK